MNAALREINNRRRRAAAVARVRQMVAEGEIDFSVIERQWQEEDATQDVPGQAGRPR